MDELVVNDEGLPLLVIVTGSRKYTDAYRVWTDLYEIEGTSRGMWGLMHGANPAGADRLARRWWEMKKRRRVRYIEMPADWSAFGRKAGVLRNQAMVDEAFHLMNDWGIGLICLAYPLPDSRGTFDMMRRVEKAGIPLYVRTDI